MAIKEAVTVRCDGDGCQAYVDVVDRNTRPEGWYHVKLVEANGKLSPTQGFDLCSLRCVTKWAKARGEVTGGRVGRYDKSIECPHCGSAFAPQGFAHHVRMAHPDEDYEATKALVEQAG